jgi:hypothetical protein
VVPSIGLGQPIDPEGERKMIIAGEASMRIQRTHRAMRRILIHRENEGGVRIVIGRAQGDHDRGIVRGTERLTQGGGGGIAAMATDGSVARRRMQIRKGVKNRSRECRNERSDIYDPPV